MSKTDWISTLTDEGLVDEFRTYDHMINVLGSYGSKDMRALYNIEEELIERGFEFRDDDTIIRRTYKIEINIPMYIFEGEYADEIDTLLNNVNEDLAMINVRITMDEDEEETIFKEVN